ncbi:MAG TPA: hypothetical protein VER96_23940 [Polyangiaceae bacterium]|nr:hypothetical protein [Polyangiaceae bacterium]
MRVKVAWVALSACCVLSSGRAARAQESRDPAAAEELFRQGRAAAEKRDYLTACTKFRESNRLDAALGTLFNIADCEEKIGRFATSWTLFREVAQRLPSDDERRGIALQRAQALEPRVPRLLVHLTPAARSDIEVRRDGVVLGSASLDTWLPVDPGEHVVIVTAPGTDSASFVARIGEGERSQLDVGVGSPSAESKPGEGSVPKREGVNHTAAYLVGGLGVAGLVTGIVAGVLVLDRKSTVDKNCTDHLCNQAGYDAAQSGKTLGVVTTVGLITGAVGLGGATYLFLSAPSPTEKSHSGAYTVGIRAKW